MPLWHCGGAVPESHSDRRKIPKTIHSYYLSGKREDQNLYAALDDFQIKSGICTPLGDCDFETGFCGWTQEVLKDDFDWLVMSHDASHGGLGPSVDHTTNTSAGSRTFGDSNNFDDLQDFHDTTIFFLRDVYR